MNKVSRKNFLKIGVGTATSVALGLTSSCNEKPYESPEKEIINIEDLPQKKEIYFNYPDEDSPCILIKIGKKIAGGIGPNSDIVAYSRLCTHMGCVLNLQVSDLSLNCICHFSKFDTEKSGQMIIGQATTNLPQIILNLSSSGMIKAVGATGLIYGRVTNKLS